MKSAWPSRVDPPPCATPGGAGPQGHAHAFPPNRGQLENDPAVRTIKYQPSIAKGSILAMGFLAAVTLPLRTARILNINAPLDISRGGL